MLFLEIRRFRWVEEHEEAVELLAPATDEAPQVVLAINSIVDVLQNLDLQLDNTLLQPDFVNPPNQNNSGGGQDDSGAGGVSGGAGNESSVIPMPKDAESVNIKPGIIKTEPSPPKVYKSILTPHRSPIKEEPRRDKTPVKSKDALADKVDRTPEQEEYRKLFSVGDHSRNFYLKEKSRMETTPVPFPPPQANSTYLIQPRPDSPKILQSPATARKSILHRTVRVQGTFFNFIYSLKGKISLKMIKIKCHIFKIF